jgi:hypothetical protein
MDSFLFLERQQSISTPTELFSNPFEITKNDAQKTESGPTKVEIEEEKKKLIQKETVQTGSVSCDIFFNCITKLN